MALLASNSSRIGAVKAYSGVTTVAGGHRRENVSPAHMHLNWSAGWHTVSGVTDRSSVPEGARHPVAWKFARKAGALASRSEADFAFAIGSLNLAAGINIAGETTLTFATPDVQLELVVSASGTTSITFALDGNAAGSLAAEGTTSISFTVPTVTLGAIISATATAGVTFSAAMTANGLGFMEGSTETTGDVLTAAQVANEVWSRLIETGLSAEDAMRLITAATAGEVSGGGTTTITIRNAVADTKNRIIATVDEDGNRTAITYDLDV